MTPFQESVENSTPRPYDRGIEPIDNIGLVGRAAIFDALACAVSESAGPTTRVAVVTGASGIGKSRVLTRACDDARRRGASVLHGRAEHLERDIPYAAFINAVTMAARWSTGADSVILTDAIDALCQAAGDGDRSAVYRTCARLLDIMSDDRPLVVAIDDLQDADEDSLTLLLALIRRAARLRVLFLLAVRDPLPEANARLEHLLNRAAEDGAVTYHHLFPLDDAEVGELVTRVADGPPHANLLADICSKSGGNPFLVVEIVRSSLAQGLVQAPGGDLMVEDGRSCPSPEAAVLGRVLPLDEHARRVASTLSVLGTLPLDHLPLLATASGLMLGEASVAFDKLVRLEILRAGPSGSDFGFAHDLLCQALREDIGPAEVRRVHASFAKGLLERRHAEQPVDAIALAHHAASAVDGPDEVAALLVTEAGDRLLPSSPASAARWYDRAIALTADDASQRPVRQGRCAQALARAGRIDAALPLGRSALRHLSSGPDRERTVGALADALFQHGDVEEALTIIEHELSRSPEAPNARLHALRASALVMLDRPNEAEEAINRAEVHAGPGSLEQRSAVVARLQLAYSSGRHDEVLTLLSNLDTLAGEATAAAQLVVWRWAASLAALCRFLPDAAAFAARARSVALRQPELGGSAIGDAVDALTEFAAGDWDSALQSIEVAIPALEADGHWMLISHLDAAEIRMRVARDEPRLAEAAARRDRCLPQQHMATWADAEATRLEAIGDLDGARSIVEFHLARTGHGTVAGTCLHATAARLAAVASDHTAALRHLDAISVTNVLTRSPMLALVVGLARADVLNDVDAARRSMLLADDLGLRFEGAQARLVLGTLGDDDGTALRDAWQTFRSIRARRWERSTAAVMRRLELPVPRERTHDGGLSDAESHLVELVLQGMRNREIADALSYSVRTVDTYLTRIYRRFGVRSRVELVRALTVGGIR